MSMGQGSDSASILAQSENKLVVFPLPFYLPETSLGFGGAGAYTFRWEGQAKNANPSQVQFVATYTLENQILLYAPFKLYFGENKYFFFGEAGYYKYFYRYFGIGARTTNRLEETYKVNFPRVTANITRQVLNNWFIGPSFWYDDFNMKEFETEGELIKGINGTEGGVVFGGGLRLIHDTRDNLFYPTTGVYGDVAWLIHDEAFGSSYNFQTLDINISKYFPISTKQVLAANFVYRETGSQAPFYHLAQHGGPKNGRGYIQGRYRDRSMFTINLEWRQKIKGRFGAVFFANYGGVSQSFDSFELNTLKPAFGLGLRYELDKINHLNVRLDYGIGNGSSEFYITVGEAF